MASKPPLQHIGFILDGNRRWAKENGLTSFEGHFKGKEQLKVVAEACFNRNIKYVTAYVFSTENWKRDKAEVRYLLKLINQVFKSDLNELIDKGIKIRIIGSKENLSSGVLKIIEETQTRTKNNNKGVLSLCFNYGGRDEIIEAAKSFINSGAKPSDLNEQSLKSHMYSHDIPDPDLIIRTSGEQRLSNFLLWGSAYAELYFTDAHWPAFDEDELDKALDEYTARQRRFGK